MFRFNNPDALLVLVLVGGAYAVVRALERGSTWWLVLAGSAVGVGFLAKMLQEFTPKMRAESSMTHNDAGDLSTVTALAASNEPKKKAFQLDDPACTAAE